MVHSKAEPLSDPARADVSPSPSDATIGHAGLTSGTTPSCHATISSPGLSSSIGSDGGGVRLARVPRRFAGAVLVDYPVAVVVDVIAADFGRSRVNRGVRFVAIIAPGHAITVLIGRLARIAGLARAEGLQKGRALLHHALECCDCGIELVNGRPFVRIGGHRTGDLRYPGIDPARRSPARSTWASGWRSPGHTGRARLDR